MRLLLLFCLFCTGAFAQAPKLINYQGLLRNSAGVPVNNKTISLRFEFRQGSPGGTLLFSEIQNAITTNQLGLFSTKIGVVNTADMQLVNWQSGIIFLSVGVDTAGTGNFTDLGAQQLVSVPYALHSESVPTSLNGNSLTIGGVTHTLPQGSAYSGSTGIAVNGSVITNSAPDQTVTIFSGNSNVVVSGSYPDYTVTSTPQLNLSGNDLSISNGNTVTLPASASPTIVGTGIANVLPPVANNYTISVPQPTFTNVGPTTISGSYPNFIVTSPTVPASGTLIAAGIATTSPGPNYTVGVQTPSFTSTGATSVTGTWPNLVVNSPASGTSQTVVAAPGIATVSPGPNFTVGVQSPTFTSTGATSVTGTWPNLVVNSPTVPTTQTVVAAPGIATVSPGPNFTVGVRTPTFTSTGATSVTGTWPNLVVNSPAAGASQTVVAAPGIATVSPGPNFTVGVQSPTFTSVGPTSVTGTWPNLVVNSPAVAITQTVVAAPGIATVSPGPNFTVGVQSPTFSSTGASSITGTWPNLVIQSPVASAQVSVTAGTAGILTVSPGPNFVVGVQQPTFTSVGITTITGAHPNYLVTTPIPPTPTVVGQGWVTVTPSTGVSFTANVPPFTYNASSGALSSGTNNVIVAPVVGYTNGIISVGPVSNSVTIPGSPWNQSAGSVTLSSSLSNVGIGTSNPNARLDIASTYTTVGGTAINVAATTNASGGPNSAVYADLGGSGSGNYISGYFRSELLSGGTGNATAAKGLAVSSNSNVGTAVGVDGRAINGNWNAGVFASAGGGSANYGLYAAVTGTNSSDWGGWFDGNVAIDGKFVLRPRSTPPSQAVSEGTIYYDQGTNKFKVSENGGAYVNLVPGTGWSIVGNAGTSHNNNFIGTTDAQDLVFKTNNTERMRLFTNGNLQLGGAGFGSVTHLDITAAETSTTLFSNGGSPGTTIRIYNTDQTNNNFSSIAFPTTLSNGGTAEMAKIAAVHVNHTIGSSQGDLAFLTHSSGIAERMRLTGQGRLGINTTAPTATLHVNGSTRLADGSEGIGKVLTSDNSGNATWQSVLPAGMVMAYAGTTIPTGWMLCDGRSLVRTAEPALFTAIGTAWGSTSSTTFNIPDMQGMFLRGVANGSANDPDRASRVAANTGGNTGDNVGSEQSHQVQTHNHDVGGTTNVLLAVGATPLVSTGGTGNLSTNTGGNETRPKNVYVYYIIKL